VVTGVDLSARQLALARGYVPGADFNQADMATIDLPIASLAAVVFPTTPSSTCRARSSQRYWRARSSQRYWRASLAG